MFIVAVYKMGKKAKSVFEKVHFFGIYFGRRTASVK